MHKNLTTVFAVMAALSAMAGVCEASGRYNLPSGIAQFFGNGFGPGYHADLVLGVSAKNRQPRGVIHRVYESPRAPHAHGFHAGASTLNARNIAPPVVYSQGQVHRSVPNQHRHAAPQYRPRRVQPQPRRPGTEPSSPSDAPVPEPISLP